MRIPKMCIRDRVYMGAIANDGTAVLPTLIKPTTFLEKQKAKIPKFGKKTKSMIDSSTCLLYTSIYPMSSEILFRNF